MDKNVPSMTLRKSVNFTRLLNGNPSRTVTSLKILEAIDRDSASACRELEESGLLLRIPSADDFPEILNDLILFLISSVVGMLLPVIYINIGNATNQKLKFAFVEDTDKVSWNQLIEPGDERVKLLLHPFLDLPLRDKPAASHLVR